MSQLSPEHLSILRQFRAKFSFFAKHNLKVKSKEGQVVPFVLNNAQEYIDGRAEDMLARKGYVRLLVLKGRQQGISTWAQARAYHKTSLFQNVSAFVLSHHKSTTDNIFAISEMYQRFNPLAPHIGKSNATQMVFDQLNSTYEVQTAGSAEIGRGGTRQFFHGSEVAFWDNAEGHFAASVESVALAPGTWIILESTAKGVSGKFYDLWQLAVAGRGDYEAVFIPWYWQTEYRRTPEEGFELSGEAPEGELTEIEYARIYGLDDAQMAWRRNKILSSSPRKFKEEYPATAEEAFQSASLEAFIDPIFVSRARKAKHEPYGPLIIGVDPAGPGGDRFSVAWRRGTCCYKIEYRDKIGHVAAVEWLKEIIDRDNPAAMFIDDGGMGGPLISFLQAKGDKYDKVVQRVNFGSKSQSKMAQPLRAGPVNRRAEMWKRCKDWLEQEGGVSIPDNVPESSDERLRNLGDHLQGDLCSVRAKVETNNDLLLTSKSDMKAKGIRSPDLGDSLALTFASTVYVEEPTANSMPPLTAADIGGYNPFGGGNGPAHNAWMG